MRSSDTYPHHDPQCKEHLFDRPAFYGTIGEVVFLLAVFFLSQQTPISPLCSAFLPAEVWFQSLSLHSVFQTQCLGCLTAVYIVVDKYQNSISSQTNQSKTVSHFTSSSYQTPSLFLLLCFYCLPKCWCDFRHIRCKKKTYISNRKYKKWKLIAQHVPVLLAERGE